MDNIKICKKITRQIKKDLTDIIDISIQIQTHNTTKQGEQETSTYTGEITSTTKTQKYTGTFTAKTYYEPLIKTKLYTSNAILIQQFDLQINYTKVEPKN